MVDICAAWDMLNALKEKPYITLIVCGEKVEFLCDTGACKTVLKTKIEGINPTNESIWVKSANGQIHREHMSKNTSFKDPETGIKVKASVVMSFQCPINLLGRDLMTKLGIAVVPVQDGMRAVRLKHSDLYTVQKDEKIYCSYDLKPVDNPHVPGKLLREARGQLDLPETEMNYNQLHVTMNILNDPQDDYVQKFLETNPVTLAVTEIFTDRRSYAAVTVLLPTSQTELYKLPANPHISLFKPHNITWADVGNRTKMASEATDYKESEDGWSYSPSCDVWKQSLCEVVTGTAQVHAFE